MSPGLRLSLAVAFLSFCAASADGPQRITASVGETVILPCSTPLSKDAPAVEWSKEGISPNVIFLYRDGCETFEMKNEDFRYRTNLIMNELKNGNISLRISNLKLTDSGTYQCMTLLDKRVIKTLELVVGAVSEPNPNLQFVPSDGDSVTLQCEAACGSPEPEIMFLDEQKIEIGAEKPQRDLDGGRCRTIKRRATLQNATSRVTCKVQQGQTSQTRETEIFIPVGCFRSSCTASIVVAVSASLLLGIFAVYLTCKKCVSTDCSRCASKSPELHTSDCSRCASKSPELHTSAAGPQTGLSPGHGQADSVRNAELQREIEKLRLALSEKESMINRLTSTVNELQPKQNPVLPRSQSLNESKSSASSAASSTASSTSNLLKHDNVPKTDESTPAVWRQNQTPGRIIRKDDDESAPVLPIVAAAGGADASSSSPSAAAAKGTNLLRSMSLSQLRRPTNLAMPRRNSLSNRFVVLENLSEEEAEQLIK